MTYYMKSSSQKMMDAINDVKRMPGYQTKPYRDWKEYKKMDPSSPVRESEYEKLKKAGKLPRMAK